MADETALKFPERLSLQAPRGLGRALDELAGRQHSTRSEVVRRTLLREVEAAGLKLAPEPARAA
jgi:predicted transcriptional regulator